MSLTKPDTKPHMRRTSIPLPPPTTSTDMKTRSNSASKILLVSRSENSSSVIKKRSLKRKCSKSQGISLTGCEVLRDLRFFLPVVRFFFMLHHKIIIER